MGKAGHLYIIYSGFLTLIYKLENQSFSQEPPHSLSQMQLVYWLFLLL